MIDSSCSASKNVAGMGRVPCALTNGHTCYHEAHWHRDGVVFAASWSDERRRIGFAELNSLRTLLAGVEQSAPEEMALALAGWLVERPLVQRALLRHLPREPR